MRDEEQGHAFRGNQYISGESSGHETNKKSDFIKEAIDKIHLAERASKLATPTNLINTPERQALRERIISQLYNKNIGSRQHGKDATIITGLPASGKSTLAKPVVAAKGAIEIDPDNAKQLLPEFNNGIGAVAIHEESSDITKSVFKQALANGDNIVWPRVDSPDKMVADIARLHALGYQVHLKHLEVPMYEAVHSALSRFLKTGRYVPLHLIREFKDTPRQAYERGKGLADSHELYERNPAGGVHKLADAKPLENNDLDDLFSLYADDDDYSSLIERGENKFSDAIHEAFESEGFTDAPLEVMPVYIRSKASAATDYDNGEKTTKTLQGNDFSPFTHDLAEIPLNEISLLHGNLVIDKSPLNERVSRPSGGSYSASDRKTAKPNQTYRSLGISSEDRARGILRHRLMQARLRKMRREKQEQQNTQLTRVGTGQAPIE